MAQPKGEGTWSTGLWDCFSDMRSCFVTFWCPCITFGQISEIVDKGESSCCGNAALFFLISLFTSCGFCYSCVYRQKLRKQYMLEESPCLDCCVHLFCLHCALCQEYRELKNRGFDVPHGWHGNAQMNNQGVALAPAVEGAMKR
ncbi:protein PLANT CADMIUM RESISTANCE 1-like [Corylus avellana]|uniref:protein PLANT CADMIUM RESISTANCE 1-like n=1 Tax=Corylus avellana TaxID=13451 RepID=UPI001E1F4E05|nr:protein PLANT CADMIUM RESISTANCE 1-like [Corylus avellana]